MIYLKKIIPLVLAAILMTVSIILMIFLKSVVMKFADPNHLIYRFYSYIDGMVWGYGNWLPIISLVFAFISLLFIIKAIINCLKSRIPKKSSIVYAVISIAASLLSFLIFWSMNGASVLIVAVLVLSAIFQYYGYRILRA